MSARVRLEAVYPCARERVWRALTDPVLIQKWIMMSTDFEPRVGHRFRFWCDPPPGMEEWGGEVRCEVIELDEPRRMVWSWEDSWKWTRFPAPTRVSFTLERAGDSTRLTLEHTRFDGPGGERLAGMLRGGWNGMLARTLAGVLAGADAVVEVVDRSDEQAAQNPTQGEGP